MTAAKMPSQVVFVIDDDASMRDAVSRLLNAVGLTVQTFASAREFLGGRLPDVPGCAVLDVRLPGLSGLDRNEDGRERDSYSSHLHHGPWRHPDVSTGNESRRCRVSHQTFP